jgi:hypothetical protein
VVLLVVGAVAGSVSAVGQATWHQVVAVIAAIAIATGILLGWVNRAQRPEREWFDGRRLAELVKAKSWQYMMRVGSFGQSDPEDRFIDELQDELKKHGKLTLGGTAPISGQLTESMRSIRRAPVETRRSVYIHLRVRDQIRWYVTRGEFHRRRALIFFAAGVIAELLALAWLIVRIALSWNLNIVGVFTSVAVAATAISQLNAHDELGQSYSLAKEELELKLSKLERVDSSRFTALVNETENVIAHEHSTWVTKRE